MTKRAVVTGALSGIGLAVSTLLTARGWYVHAFDVKIGHNVTDRIQVVSYFSKAGPIDLLVNCAGICNMEDFATQPYAQWSNMLDVNVKGTMLCCQEAVHQMRDGGDIVNIASRAGVYGHEGLAAYCASKAAVIGFSEALALDLRKRNIRVAYIMPGTVATGLGGIHKPEDWQIQPHDVAKTVCSIVDLPRNAAYGRIEIKPSFPPS